MRNNRTHNKALQPDGFAGAELGRRQLATVPRLLSLDTNCLIELEQGRPAAGELRRIIDLHQDGRCDVALIGVSASERLRGGGTAPDYSCFSEFVKGLGLEHLKVLPPLGIFDVSYWGHCLWASPALAQQVDELFSILFPAASREPPDGSDPDWGRWLNRMCDALMVWTHVHHGREVFVTLDQNFHRKAERLAAQGVRRIDNPRTVLGKIG